MGVRRNNDVVKQPPLEPVPDPERTYLLYLSDNETTEKMVIKERDILTALTKFSEQFQEVCSGWTGLSITIEEIEVL